MAVEATFVGAKGQADIRIELVPEGKPLEQNRGYLVIDGIRCSPEALRMLIVSPNPDVLLSSHRSGDTLAITAHAREIATPEQIELRALERMLAYEHCGSLLESHCVHEPQDDGSAHTWLNLLSADIDVTDQTKYLQARGLLDLHPSIPGVVSVRDEDEPLPAEGVL